VTGLDPALEVRDLAVHFTLRGGWFDSTRLAVKAVDGVDLTIGAGETLGLVGESGCGKSTLSNAIVGLVPPTRGSIRIRGQEIAGATRKTLHAVRRHVQMVFQDPGLSLNPRATIGAAIAEPLIARGIATGQALEKRVDTLLAQVGLPAEHAKRYPHQFSGGQRQRIVIARALALEPALVVCDEPVSALDVSVRAQILNLLVDLQRRMGVSYLFVSHDLSVVRHISDRVAVMYLGRIVEQASRDIFFAAPKHPYAQALMSAVPDANPVVQRAKRRLVLSGELPSPTDVPPGCPFHTRCPLATEICARERPLLTPRPDGARVACHHA
jgi:oligopeptide transport system ATP-binding protein